MNNRSIPSRKRWHFFASWSLLAIISVKVIVILARGPMGLELDALEYWNLSSHVLAGDLWLLEVPIAYRTPIYPWFLGAIRLVAGSWALIGIVILQGCMIVATTWLAASLAVIMSRSEIARVWTLLASLVFISSIPFGQAVLSEVMFTFCLMLHLYFQAKYIESPSFAGAFTTSLALAVSILTRPIAMLLWLVDLVWLCKPGHKNGSHWLVMAATLFLSLIPWMGRNAMLFGKPSLTEFMGRNLWIVTFQGQAGAGLDLPDDIDSIRFRERIVGLLAGDAWRDTWSVSNALIESGLNDAEADRAMQSVCIKAILEEPRLFLDRMLRRVINFWRCVSTHIPHPTTNSGLLDHQVTWGYANALVDRMIEKRWSLSVLTNTLFAGLIGLATLVLIYSRATRWWGLWTGLILVYFSVITGFFEIPAYRYRMVLEPLMISILGAAIAVLFNPFEEQTHRPAQ